MIFEGFVFYCLVYYSERSDLFGVAYHSFEMFDNGIVSKKTRNKIKEN